MGWNGCGLSIRNHGRNCVKVVLLAKCTTKQLIGQSAKVCHVFEQSTASTACSTAHLTLNKNYILCNHKQSNHLSKVALEGPIDSIGLAGQGGGCIILGNSERVAAMHPVVLARAIIDLATGCWRPPWTLSHNCTSQATGHLEMSC